MIPKIIHYCWFGGNPLPELAIRCINSWKKYLPEYEIKEWNEDNFDVNIIPYTKEAYENKKYAFVSDYALFWILYHYGGVYFDTDVEVIKPMDSIIQKAPYMGCETLASSASGIRVAPGLGLAAPANLNLYSEILDFYSSLKFVVDGKQNLTTVVEITTGILKEKGLVNIDEIQEIEGIRIYPAEYFAARDIAEFTIPQTENSYSIHYYAGSWKSKNHHLKFKILNLFPNSLVRLLVRFKRFILRR